MSIFRISQVHLSSTAKPEAVSSSETLTAIYIYLLTWRHKPENSTRYTGAGLGGPRLWATSTEMEISLVGSEDLTAVFMKCTVFWHITPCTSSPLKVNWRFGGTYHLHFLGWRISRTRRALLATCFLAGFFLGLFSDSEDEGGIFLRNVH
jgi:hypothetical protein